MITSYANSFHTWVLAQSSQPPQPVGRLVDFVIHPDSGVFEALWVATPEGHKLLAPRDIVSWNEEEICVADEQEILRFEDFPRLEKVMDKEVPILCASVFQEPGKVPLGKVIDFGFDTISPKILSIKVRSGWWIFGSEKIISRDCILAMTPDGIFVSAPTVRLGKEEDNAEVLDKMPSQRTDCKEK